MAIPDDYSFTHYLAAKATVDDRALNTHVWNAFTVALRSDSTTSSCRILEIGSGIGTMVQRILRVADFEVGLDYYALDASPKNTRLAADRLAACASDRGQAVSIRDRSSSNSPHYEITIAAPQHTPQRLPDLQLHLLTSDFFDFATQSDDWRRFDIILAHAFIDLVDVPRALEAIKRIASPHATLYLTINFDGSTIFQPDIDPEFDALVERLYHETMDRRIVNGAPSGDSRTGRHLYHNLVRAGFTPYAAGPSDWVVIPRSSHPGPDVSAYPDDEAYFLHFLVNTVYRALAGHSQLSDDRFRAWIRQRHRQIEEGDLVYIAHQIDYLAKLEDGALPDG